MTEEKAKSLIGRKVRGFKFEDNTDGVGYPNKMDWYIDRIGVIDSFFKEGCVQEFFVDFEDDGWWYPASLIEAHLEEEEPTSEEIRDSLKYEHPYKLEIEDLETDTSEIEQLKAENAEFLELLKMHVENRKGAYKFMNNIEKELHEKTKQTLEKHGK